MGETGGLEVLAVARVERDTGEHVRRVQSGPGHADLPTEFGAAEAARRSFSRFDAGPADLLEPL